MDSSESSPVGSVKRHSRNVSYTRPRRSTRGPLEVGDDPLADTLQSPQSALEQPSSRASEEQPLPSDAEPAVDLTFLQDHGHYHAVPTGDIHEAFLHSQNQPPLGVSLADLIQQGHFRRAAETAVDDLLKCPSHEAVRILQLLCTRLACLVLVQRPQLAAREAAPLTEVLARNSPGASDIISIIPWELRLLLVRLQAITATDGGRRSVMALYALAAEVRSHIISAKDVGKTSEVIMWSNRLQDLGLRVVDTLVEMGELETATRHLDTLNDVDKDEMSYRKALLRFRVGDVAGAQHSYEALANGERRSALDALAQYSGGEFAEGTARWQELAESHPNHAEFASNLAVGLLYTGRISEARDVLEGLTQTHSTFPGLLFNLGTVWELCTEQAVERKTALAQQMASKPPVADSGGWERSNFEFKL